MTESNLRVNDLSHTFRAVLGRGGRGRLAEVGLAALESVDLTATAGEFVALVGPSGCGKSTMLRCIAGLLSPSAGSATFGGTDLIGNPGHVAFMPQRDSLLPWRRALDNAILGAEIDGSDTAVARRTALSMFEQFGLAGFDAAWPSELSGGMRQRLALLRTFMFRRDLLALDEPFGALDALTRRDMVHWLQQVWLNDRRTVLMVTHDVEEAILLANRVDVFSARPGRVVDRVAVDYPFPRSRELIVEAGFQSLRQRILHALES